jgi:hypothetical protein
MLTTCCFVSLISPLPTEIIHSFSDDRPFEENSLCIPIATKQYLRKEFHYDQEKSVLIAEK